MKLYDVWEQSIYRVKVPLPFPLRWVNSYVIPGKDGWTTLDPGIHTPDAVAVWKKFFHETDVSVGDIAHIVLTHHHPDHYGLSGWMQQQSGAKVSISEQGFNQTQLLWGPERTMTDLLLQLFAEHGMDGERLAKMKDHYEGFISLVTPEPQITLLPIDQSIKLGEREFSVIHTGGHAEGHLSFWDEENGVIFCGDHVIPQITPNVSYLPGVDENPLQSFLHSLKKMEGLHVARAYPGHRHPFTNFAERIREILLHHEQRLEQIETLSTNPVTAYEMCNRLFGTNLSVHQQRFAFGETLAHLIFLHRAGRIDRISKNGVVYWES